MRPTFEQRDRPADEAVAPLVVPLHQVRAEDLPLVGGKAANLGELFRAGLPVPPGFCVTTSAYDQVVAGAPEVAVALAALERASQEEVPALAERARAALLAAPVPAVVAEAIRAAYRGLGAVVPVAVRSSATAEDLPEASFAGQQETYLNVVGEEAVLEAVRACWASLWTERAVVYRASVLRQAPDERAWADTQGADTQVRPYEVRLAVVVQRLVPAAWAGVLFTANPLTGCRTQAAIDASPGLGEAVVSGLVTPDRLVIDRLARRIVERHPGERARVVVRPAAGGGTVRETSHGEAGALPDADALALVSLAERVEQHFGGMPQDIEWAIDADGTRWLLQARPITTLFPLPEPASRDGRVHAYGSINVFQGVLGPLTPMGLDTFRRFSAAMANRVFGIPADPAVGAPVLAVAGERLYVDVSGPLRSAVGRRALVGALSMVEPRTAGALRSLLEDARFAVQPGGPWRLVLALIPVLRRTRLPLRVLATLAWPSGARRQVQRRVDELVAQVQTPTRGPLDALERAETLLDELAPPLMARLIPLVVTGVASFRVAQHLAGPELASEALRLTRGLPYNPTTEMDLALGALAARWAGDPTMGPLLRSASAEALRDSLAAGRLPVAFQRDLGAFLSRWGCRAVAEIDLGVPRWEDDPTHVLGVLANLARNGDPARQPERQFHAARAEARAAARRIAARLPLGRRLLFWLAVSRVRALLGLRELPKFSIIRLFSALRGLLREVGAELARAGRLEQRDDVFFLTFSEARRGLAGADPSAGSGQDLRALVGERKRVYERERGRRHAPRVLLSDGTALDGPPSVRADGALLGSPASPGLYEGTVRVVLDPQGARLEPGEVLVAPSTDPGWTPLFLTAGALVMEMGGMMSHGAVVAREYGLAAVVGVPEATTRLATGMRVRVDGSSGVVVVVSGPEPA